LAELDNNQAGHYLCKRSNLLTIFAIERNHHFYPLFSDLTDYIAFCSYFGRRTEWLSIVFTYLLHQKQLCFPLLLLFALFVAAVKIVDFDAFSINTFLSADYLKVVGLLLVKSYALS